LTPNVSNFKAYCITPRYVSNIQTDVNCILNLAFCIWSQGSSTNVMSMPWAGRPRLDSW